LKWTVTTPPAVAAIDSATAQTQARIDALVGGEVDWFDNIVIPNAISTCQNEANLSLITQTITAIAYDECDPAVHQSTIRLPRGPVQQIVSVTDANSVSLAGSSYELRREGLTDYLRIKTTNPAYPLTIVYKAGFGDDASSIPPDLMGIMLAHVAFLYDNRNGAPPPDGLDRIFRKYRGFAL
jgi:uncharacterized phiE125 gp8 family phage protein